MNVWAGTVASEDAMMDLGRRLAFACFGRVLIFLKGDLGAGKTTLARGLIKGLGYEGVVKSPTYTLVETYVAGGYHVNHLDLYRMADPEELEFIGIRDLLAVPAITLIEWPERGEGMLPEPDLCIELEDRGDRRVVTMRSENPMGNMVIKGL